MTSFEYFRFVYYILYTTIVSDINTVTLEFFAHHLALLQIGLYFTFLQLTANYGLNLA